jgi:low temperature requirement protein LtrA
MSNVSVLREHGAGESPEVTTPELFFDLVYVFAVTQLSHTLHEHLSGRGALETLVLFLAVWWAWNYTAWATNWIDPRDAAVRLLLLVLMLISLVMSAAIPQAFHGRGVAFAAAYVGLQVARSGFMVIAFRGQQMARNYLQLLTWTCIAGVLWLVGAFLHDDARLILWIGAVVVDYGAPLHGFALPQLGRTAMSDWPLAGGHLAERNQLVVLIALGESILAVGATFAGIHWTAATTSAFVVGFATSAALWWTYFGRADEAADAIQRARDPAKVARAGFAYAHGIMVAGVIVVGVAIDLAIAEPHADSAWRAAATILGGPALYLAGNILYKRSLASGMPTSRVVAIGALGCLVPAAPAVDRLVLSVLTMLVLLSLAAWTTAGASGRPGAEPPEGPRAVARAA